jgi:DNA-directed RNA polymerase subunit omega
MLYPSISQLLRNIDNRYLLVNITAKRARDIAEEKERSGESLDQKPVKTAINEIAEGRLRGRLRDGHTGSARQ